jgi:hypothetical protein
MAKRQSPAELRTIARKLLAAARDRKATIEKKVTFSANGGNGSNNGE